VILSRLKSAGLVLPIGRGRYRLIRQENLTKLQELRMTDKKLYQLALEIYKKCPDLKALVFYGSRISGSADAFSDYDAMVITEAVHHRAESRRIERELAKELGIKVHLTTYSEKNFKTFAMIEPHLKFWLNDAVVLMEGWKPGQLPPTARWGYREALYLAEGYIEVGDESKDSHSATCYLVALRIILMVEHALKLDYNYENVRREVEQLVGKRLSGAVRKNHLSPKGIKEKEINKLGELTRRKLREVRRVLESIGENESDMRWKVLRK
jgi:predicted nucleotidyltransferase